MAPGRFGMHKHVMICDATDVSMSSLCEAMNEAFSDYPVPVQLSQDSFDLMMRMRGMRRQHSRLACVEGQIAAFWLVGVRNRQGYLISSGTRPAFRRRGLSKFLGRAVIDHLVSIGVTRLQTEVLVNNPSARALYAELGLNEDRILDSFEFGAAPSGASAPSDIQTTPIPFAAVAREMWDSVPSWQNDLASLSAAAADATCFASYDESGLGGYAAFVPKTNTLAQLAVRKDRRRNGLGTALLAHGQRRLGLETLKIINVDRTDSGLTAFLKKRGAAPLVSQRELVLEL